MKNKKKHLAICGTIILIFAILSTLALFGTKETYSDSERRPLASAPTLSWQNIVSGNFMEQFEDFAADTFPFREGFRGLKAVTSLYAMGQKSNNDIYLHDGYLSSAEYPMDVDSIQYAADVFAKIYQQYLKDANTNIYVTVIPDKNAYLAEDAGQLSMDYQTFEDELVEAMPYATPVHIGNLLSIQDYYRTDSHWRQEQITDVAALLLTAMKQDSANGYPTQESTFTEASENGDSRPLADSVENTHYTVNNATEDFHGVYYGQAALPLAGESLSYLTSDEIEQLTAYDHEHDQAIPIYNMEKVSGKDPYEMFLSGSLSLVTIENPSADSEEELIIFRDSYASSLAPLLALGYSKVTLIDIRYLPTSQLGKYVDFTDSDVLFLYSTLVLNNSETLK